MSSIEECNCDQALALKRSFKKATDFGARLLVSVRQVMKMMNQYERENPHDEAVKDFFDDVRWELNETLEKHDDR